MTKQEIKQGATVTVNGELVRVIAVDSDLRCMVWGCAVADPDRSVWFYRHEAA